MVPLETVMSVRSNVPVAIASPKSIVKGTGSALLGLVSVVATAGVGPVLSFLKLFPVIAITEMKELLIHDKMHAARTEGD